MSATRTRRFNQWVAASCAALVLVLSILAASPQAHHWLHHDAGADDHECAVTIFAHGTTAAVTVVMVPIPAAPARDERAHPSSAEVGSLEHRLPFSSGPPLAL